MNLNVDHAIKKIQVSGTTYTLANECYSANTADWAASDYIPGHGELIVYNDVCKIKIGDGVNKAADLSFISGGVGRLVGEDGIVFNDEVNNQAIAQCSIAAGQNTIAGWHGFQILHSGNVQEENMASIVVDDIDLEPDQKARLLYSVGDIMNIDAKSHTYNKVKVNYVFEVESSYPDPELGPGDNAASHFGIPLEYAGYSCIIVETLDGSAMPKSFYDISATPEDNWLWCASKNVGVPIACQIAPMALGAENTAAGNGAFAAGRQARAFGDYATALGRDNDATYASFVAGRANKAIGMYSFAVNNNNKATANYSAAIGQYNEATGDRAFATGHKTVASGVAATTFGNGTKATGTNSVAMGTGTTASGTGSVAIGTDTTEASGASSFATGRFNKAEGQGSAVFGYHSTAKGGHSIAAGSYSVAGGNFSFAMGVQAQTVADGQTAVGKFTDMKEDMVFGVGNGYNENGKNYRRNALSVFADGHVEIQTQGDTDNSVITKGSIKPLADSIEGMELSISDLGIVVYANQADIMNQWSSLDQLNNDVANIGQLAYGTADNVDSLIEETEGLHQEIVDAESRIDESLSIVNEDIAQNSRDIAVLAEAIGQIEGGVSRTVVEELPSVSEASESVIYMVPNGNEAGENFYDEYMFIDGRFELIGSTQIDLSSKPGQLGEGENSAVFNDYSSNQAIAAYSSVSGTNSTAGWMGYPIIASGYSNGYYSSDIAYFIVSDKDLATKASEVYDIGDVINIDGQSHTYGRLIITQKEIVEQYYKDRGEAPSDYCENLAERLAIDWEKYEGNSVFAVKLTDSDEKVPESMTNLSSTPEDNWLWCIDKNVGVPITCQIAPMALGNNNKAAGNGAFSAGKDNTSNGDYSATLGRSNKAGYASFAVGRNNNAMGMYAFAANAANKALGTYSAAFGQNSEANGQYSFAVGEKAKANGSRSVAFGSGTSTGVDASSAAVFGSKSQANGTCSFAAGNTAIANGMYSVAFGYNTNANADYSFAVGSTSTADGIFSVALNKGKTIEGANSALAINEATAEGVCSLAQGSSTAKGGRSVALGSSTASGNYSMAQGQSTASGLASASFGLASAEADYALAQGTRSRAMAPNAVAFGQDTQAKGTNSLAGGNGTIAYGHRSIALGQNTIAGNPDSASTGQNSFAFGSPATYTSNGETLTDYTTASGNCAVSFGYGNIASGQAAFIAGGQRNKAEGQYSFVAGNSSKATGKSSAAIGSGCNAKFDQSFAFGNFVSTTAKYQAVFGKFAKMGTDMLFGIGDGTGNKADGYANEYRNAFSVFTDGHAEVRTQGETDNSVVTYGLFKDYKTAATEAYVLASDAWTDISYMHDTMETNKVMSLDRTLYLNTRAQNMAGELVTSSGTGARLYQYIAYDEYNNGTWCGEFTPVRADTLRLGSHANPWSAVYSTQGVIQTSARDAKENIKNVLSGTVSTWGLRNPVEASDITTEDVVDFVRNLQPVTFNYKGSEAQESEQLGLIADDIAEHPIYKYIGIDRMETIEIEPAEYDEEGNIVKEATSEEKRVLGLQALPLATVALSTCQELLNKIEILEARIEELESR